MLDTFQHIYAHRDVAARAWKAQGGQIVGVIGEGAPETMIAAAGFLAYRLSGDPDLPLANVRHYLHASFNKGQSERPIRLAWVEAIIEKLLNGSFDFVDYLVIPYNRKEIAQVHTKLRDIARDWPQFRLPEAVLLDRAVLGDARAQAYNAARDNEFKAQLESWAGGSIGDAAIRAASDARDESRAEMAKVQQMRGVRLSGSDALAIMGASRMMPRDAFNRALKDLLASDLPPAAGKRVFLGGSAPDSDMLYRCIENARGQVVGENHDWGQRMFEPEGVSMVTFPLSRSVAACVARAKACQAEAVIHFVHADDSWQMWDVPDEQRALKAMGLPCLYLAQQPYRIDEVAITAQISAFLA